MSKILIIDDSASIRQLVGLTMKDAGYEVTEAVDGVDALQKLDNAKFNLIICDVNMPNLDGLEFLDKLKSDPNYAQHKFTPVIMLTTVTEEDKKSQGKAAGAKAWVVKPFLPERLVAAVQKLMVT